MIELKKVPVLVSLAEDYLGQGMSVLIFVNFKMTLELLMKKLKTKSIVAGGQTAEERNQIIDNFLENKERIMICNVQAGGESHSYHDIKGEHPRVSLISPPWSASKFRQIVGRTRRAQGKSASLCKLVYIAGTIEESVCKNLNEGNKFLSELNGDDQLSDGDLNHYAIEGLDIAD